MRKTLLFLLTLLTLCILGISCVQDPLNLTQFDDLGFSTQGKSYDNLIEMERPYGKTLATYYEINDIPVTLQLIVNENNTASLLITDGTTTQELDGTWEDWATFNVSYKDWPEPGKTMLLKREGIYLTFQGDEPGIAGLIPADYDSRILFTYNFNTCDIRDSEDGRYQIYSPKVGASVDFKCMYTNTSPLIKPLWRYVY